MTEINFYVSKEEGLENRFAIAYRLINLAKAKNFSIHIHTSNQSESNKFDSYLWKKESSSFIPHSIVEANNSEDEKTNEISISHEFEPIKNCDYLVNLSNNRPAFFSRFLKVAEILDSNDEILTAGRKRYSFYRDRGYTLGYHKL